MLQGALTVKFVLCSSVDLKYNLRKKKDSNQQGTLSSRIKSPQTMCYDVGRMCLCGCMLEDGTNFVFRDPIE